MSGPSWLALKVTDAAKTPDAAPKGAVFISVPKKVVRLATRRNRLKRLLREATRSKAVKSRRTLLFRVTRFPGDIGLAEASSAVERLLDQA